MKAHSPVFSELLSSLMHPGLKQIDLSLDRIERHLAAIGDPQERIPPVIHIAGTNGKGSTVAFLKSMFNRAGYRCHVFTSPHLVHFRERVVVGDVMLTESELMPRLEAIKARTQSYPLTFFEANTVLALELFAEYPADITLLEVGMGGRFDATNVIAKPLCSVITPISFDHQEFLGNTIDQIAFEKAGIIKPGVPVFTAPQHPDALDVLRRQASLNDSPFTLAEPLPQNVRLGLFGEHQRVNGGLAATVAHAIKSRGFPAIHESFVAEGLATASWPGRLQQLSQGPLLDALKENVTLYLDGGHNASAASALADWARMQDKPVYLVLAMSAQKDVEAFLTPLKPVISGLILCEIPDEPFAMPLEQLARAAESLAIAYKTAKTPLDAMQLIPFNSIGLIAGSLYLCGAVLQKNR